jgi:hypothetical protein
MICNAIDYDQFLALVSNNTRNVLVEIFFEGGCDQRPAATDCKHRLDIDLREGIRHEITHSAPNGAKGF